jgi:hypothetical protein
MQLIEELSSSHPGELFEEEIVIQIVTNNVPDLVFTDYPGITTEDKVLCDSGEGKTLKLLIQEEMKKPYNVVVIVEPASREDFNTSHIYPLVLNCLEDRPDLMENTILVRTKCDKISQTSFPPVVHSILDNPLGFGHVIATINLVDSIEAADPDNLSFADFRTRFHTTKTAEVDYFSHFCPPLTDRHVRTSALIQAMDQVFFRNLDNSIAAGITSIQAEIAGLQETMKRVSAPASYCYHSYSAEETSASPLCGIEVGTIVADFKKELPGIVLGLCESFASQQADDLRPPSLSLQEWDDVGVNVRSSLAHGAETAADRYGRFQSQKKLLDRRIIPFAKLFLSRFDAFMLEKVFGPALFQREHSPFHQIARFPKLVEHVLQSVRDASREWKSRVEAVLLEDIAHRWKILDVLSLFSLEEVNDLLTIEIPQSIFNNYADQVLTSWERVDEDIIGVELLADEEADFSKEREYYERKFISLKQQETILLECRYSQSHEELKMNLQLGQQEGDGTHRHPWLLRFWFVLYYSQFQENRQDVLAPDLRKASASSCVPSAESIMEEPENLMVMEEDPDQPAIKATRDEAEDPVQVAADNCSLSSSSEEKKRKREDIDDEVSSEDDESAEEPKQRRLETRAVSNEVEMGTEEGNLPSDVRKEEERTISTRSNSSDEGTFPQPPQELSTPFTSPSHANVIDLTDDEGQEPQQPQQQSSHSSTNRRLFGRLSFW